MSMTLTDLEKLEALHAAVPQCDEEPIEAWFKADVAYRSALHNAFPAMAKALREAWAALDQVSSDDRMSEAQIIATITAFQKERDEARAEVRRLREAIARFVSQYPWQDGPEIQELKALEGKA